MDKYFALIVCIYSDSIYSWAWSGGAMVLGKLPVPARPTHLD